jgi:hypothetical protein
MMLTHIYIVYDPIRYHTVREDHYALTLLADLNRITSNASTGTIDQLFKTLQIIALALLRNTSCDVRFEGRLPTVT